MLAQFGEAADDEELLTGGGWVDFFVLEDPGVTVRDEDGVQAGGHRGVDVGFRAVADHPCGVGVSSYFSTTRAYDARSFSATISTSRKHSLTPERSTFPDCSA